MRPRPRRVLALLVPFALLSGASGCLGNGEDAVIGPPQGPHGDLTPKEGFAIHDLRVEALDGQVRLLREDDRALVRFTLEHAEDAEAPMRHFVSVLVDGKVVRSEEVLLSPGARAEREHEIPGIRDRQGEMQVQVRAGGSSATTQAEVKEWPRTREAVDLGNLSIFVNRWLANETYDGTHVNVTLSSYTDTLPGDFHARLLCADRQGTVTEHGKAYPPMPEPGTNLMVNVDLPGCRDDTLFTLYGVVFHGIQPGGEDITMRVLFVERGWRPPDPM